LVLIDDVFSLFADGSAKCVDDVVNALGVERSLPSQLLFLLWKRGQLLRTEKPVSFSFLRYGRWHKGSRHYYVRGDLCPSGLGTVEVSSTEALTRRTEVKKLSVRFVGYVVKPRPEHLRREAVYKFVKGSGTALSSAEVAAHFKCRNQRAGQMLNSLVKEGLVSRRGLWNERVGKAVPFFFGYLYGVTDEQFKAALDQSSRFVNIRFAMERKIDEDSVRGYFTPLRIFVRAPYNYNKDLVTYHAKNIGSLKFHEISGNVFVYRPGRLTPEQVLKQTRYWEARIRERGTDSLNIGVFHEDFGQKALDAQKPVFSHVFWKQKHTSKRFNPYNILISSRRELDRVLQMDTKFGHVSIRNLAVFEFKYHSGGLTKEIVDDFLGKLRNSYEFGYEVEIREGNAVLKTRMIKMNVTPIIVCPIIQRGGEVVGKEVIEYARRMGVQIISTWQLSRNLGISFKKAYELQKKGLDWAKSLKVPQNPS